MKIGDEVGVPRYSVSPFGSDAKAQLNWVRGVVVDVHNGWFFVQVPGEPLNTAIQENELKLWEI